MISHQEKITNLMADGIRCGDVRGVKTLLSRYEFLIRCKPNRVSEQTWLHLAAERDMATVVLLLVDAGANVNARDEFGVTPLFQAVFNGYVNVAKSLLACGADPNTSVLAVANDDLSFVSKEFKGIKGKPQEETPLWSAVSSRDLKMVQLLLTHGADVFRECRGKSPLEAAQALGHADMADAISTWIAMRKADEAVNSVNDLVQSRLGIRTLA